MIPVVTIDGPSGSGKGTLARKVANALGWHFLDSGALYRLLALAVSLEGLDIHDEQALAAYAAAMPVRFGLEELDTDQLAPIYLGDREVSRDIRSEACGNRASEVAAVPSVRQALLALQRDFQQAPGLVADGRDMGTVVFPEAQLKLYLEASCEERAKRRFDQLKASGLDANLGSLLEEIKARDARDKNRPVAPLRPAADAIVVDTTELSAEQVFEQALGHVRRVFGDFRV